MSEPGFGPAWYQDLSKPCVIIGNGPSLQGVDFAKFDGYCTFGMNVAYRHWETLDWYPDYYLCLDEVVGLHHKEQIGQLIEQRSKFGIRQFLLRGNLINALGSVALCDAVLNFDEYREQIDLFAAVPITTGSHACAWAVALGFTKVVVVGVDCRYVEQVPGSIRRKDGSLEISAADAPNPNYYFEGYQAIGDRYNLPNPSDDIHLNSWRSVAAAIDRYPVKVINANTQSNLDCFPIMSLAQVNELFRVDESSEKPIEAVLERVELSSSATKPKLGSFVSQSALWLKRRSSNLHALARFGFWILRSLGSNLPVTGVVLLILMLLLSVIFFVQNRHFDVAAQVAFVFVVLVWLFDASLKYADRLQLESMHEVAQHASWANQTNARLLKHNKDMLMMEDEIRSP